MAKKKLTAVSLEPRDREILSSFIEGAFPEGIFSAAELLERASPRNSPIHKFFEWDDSKAAHLYRLKQARGYIQCLVVEIEGNETRKYVPPVYVAGVDAKRYVDIDVARKTKDLWEQVVERAMNEALVWRNRYRAYDNLSLIHGAIDKTKKKLGVRDEKSSSDRKRN